MLPCSLEEAVIAAERVREAFADSGIVVEDGPVDTTVSIGVAGGPARHRTEVLLAAADTALYQAKRGGRNRVEAAEELPLVAGKLAAKDGRRRASASRSDRAWHGWREGRAGNAPFTIRSISLPS